MCELRQWILLPCDRPLGLANMHGRKLLRDDRPLSTFSLPRRKLLRNYWTICRHWFVCCRHILNCFHNYLFELCGEHLRCGCRDLVLLELPYGHHGCRWLVGVHFDDVGLRRGFLPFRIDMLGMRCGNILGRIGNYLCELHGRVLCSCECERLHWLWRGLLCCRSLVQLYKLCRGILFCWRHEYVQKLHYWLLLVCKLEQLRC